MKCTVSWTGASGTRSAMGFVAETGSGHVIAMDGAPDPDKPDQSGQNIAARPMELLLAGAGGCTAYDVVLMLKRGRHSHRPQSLHAHQYAFHRARHRHCSQCDRTRHQAEPRQILLGQHHARQNR